MQYFILLPVLVSIAGLACSPVANSVSKYTTEPPQKAKSSPAQALKPPANDDSPLLSGVFTIVNLNKNETINDKIRDIPESVSILKYRLNEEERTRLLKDKTIDIFLSRSIPLDLRDAVFILELRKNGLHIFTSDLPQNKPDTTWKIQKKDDKSDKWEVSIESALQDNLSLTLRDELDGAVIVFGNAELTKKIPANPID